MNHCYRDILDLSPTPPLWFDEHAVPRFCDFAPNETANIYADEACLLLIECQSCGTEFPVAFTWCKHDHIFPGRPAASLSDRVRENSLDYGDPPNIECCPAGPTMSSMPIRVAEFWTRADARPRGWERVPELEVEQTS